MMRSGERTSCIEERERITDLFQQKSNIKIGDKVKNIV
jgi:hypothetical protein